MRTPPNFYDTPLFHDMNDESAPLPPPPPPPLPPHAERQTRPRMQRYDIRDTRTNLNENDPVIAAETRLKKSSLTSWRLLGVGLVVFCLVLLLLAVFFSIVQFAHDSRRASIEIDDNDDEHVVAMTTTTTRATTTTVGQLIDEATTELRRKPPPLLLRRWNSTSGVTSPTPSSIAWTTLESRQTATPPPPPPTTSWSSSSSSPLPPPTTTTTTTTTMTTMMTTTQPFVTWHNPPLIVLTSSLAPPTRSSSAPSTTHRPTMPATRRPMMQTTRKAQRAALEPLIFSHEEEAPSSSSSSSTRAPLISTPRVLKTCSDYAAAGYTQSGVYTLGLASIGEFYAHCEMRTDEQNEPQLVGWMTLQRRQSAAVNFHSRSFAEYDSGFGDVNGDHWLGLQKVRALIDAGYALRLRVEAAGDRCGDESAAIATAAKRWTGEYEFAIGTRRDRYLLTRIVAVSGDFSEPRVMKENVNATFITADVADRTHCKHGAMGGFWLPTRKPSAAGFSPCTYIAPNGAFSCDGNAAARDAFLAHRVYRAPGEYLKSYSRPQTFKLLVRACSSSGCV